MFSLKDSGFFLPTPYPGEHLFSMLNRFYMRFGPALNQAQTIEVFRGFNAVIDPLNPVSFSKFENPEKLMDYSTYPFFLWPQTAAFKQNFRDVLDGNYKNSYLYMFPQRYYCLLDNKNDYYVCYCPDCLKEDFDEYGEGYLRAAHQIDGCRVCVKHFRKLIPIRLQRHEPFFLLDSSMAQEESGIPLNREILLSRFLCEPPETDRHSINQVILPNIRKLTLSDKESHMGRVIFERAAENLEDSFLEEYGISPETITRTVKSLFRNLYLHPADLAILMLGLNIQY